MDITKKGATRYLSGIVIKSEWLFLFMDPGSFLEKH